MKALDIVRTPKGAIGIVNETQSNGNASIDYLDENPHHEKSAWWYPGELQVVNNLPNILARAMIHPFSSHHDVANNAFPVEITVPGQYQKSEWISEKAKHMFSNIANEIENRLMWKIGEDVEATVFGSPEEKDAYQLKKDKEEYRNHLKFAWVFIDGKRQMIMVHNANMMGYKLKNDSYMEGLVEPLEEQSYQGFDRWCTNFDL